MSVICLVSGIHPKAAAAEIPKYNKDIRPILSDKCFQCHGPDAAKREGELRLGRPRGSDQGEARSSPENRRKARLVTRIHEIRSGRGDATAGIAPTTDRHRTRRRSSAGSSRARNISRSGRSLPCPLEVPLPETRNPDWAKQEIDRFIAARLEQENLSPSPAAAPERWLRRTTFDLTGLPPTRAEIDAFLNDTSPDARARAVDRLLASPRYGEKMAVDWLDVARYADSFGYQSDLDTHAWPYRDWVIDAFNKNLPWDQFITWQVAGDLLPNPIARANHRHRLQPRAPQDPGRRQRRGGIPAGGNRRQGPHLRHGVSRADLRMRPLPRSQV